MSRGPCVTNLEGAFLHGLGRFEQPHPRALHDRLDLRVGDDGNQLPVAHSRHMPTVHATYLSVPLLPPAPGAAGA